jgi:hypothetical protein
LPSPPATNSTGSGSTGDPASIAVRGGRLNMLNGTNIKTFHAAFSSASAAAAADDEQDDYDNDNDDGDGEDNTARLDQQRRHSASENVLALQRVKSLTQRNKMVRFPLLLALESFLTVFGLFSFIYPNPYLGGLYVRCAQTDDKHRPDDCFDFLGAYIHLFRAYIHPL